jgi:hypothetical protein
LRDTEAFKHGPARWIQAIAAHFFSWKSRPLEDKRFQTSRGAKRRTARSGRTGAHNRHIKNFHDISTGDL